MFHMRDVHCSVSSPGIPSKGLIVTTWFIYITPSMKNNGTLNFRQLSRLPCVLLEVFWGVMFVLMPNFASAQDDPKVSFACDDVSIRECVQKLPLSVTMDEFIASQKVRIQLAEVTPADGLSQIMEASGISNYVVLYDQAGKHATVSNLAAGSKAGAETNPLTSTSPTLPETSVPAKNPEAVAQAQKAPSQPSFPSEKELEALVEASKSAPPVGPDTVLEFPGGAKITVRQLQADQERAAGASVSPSQQIMIPGGDTSLTLQSLNEKQRSADKATADPTAQLSIPGVEKPLTLQDLKTKQAGANNASKNVQQITLPNGIVLNAEQLKDAKGNKQSTTTSVNNADVGSSAKNPIP